ncbi:adenylate/guanylate cyclase domain-containing protein [Flavobacterium sinopsychrotolerans]|uniref:adenylate/guanylate cyclase domain-containing protein n=1 Tax=Flavobacterium sinopsychrotolerans TaxID=604089 RepID=UPI001FCA89BF|nr:adenylate/guanylate cyclase domain-containing protein [Flavobacterium sinopsychrotolerans]
MADSLVKIYQKNKLGNSEKLELLRNLSFNEVNNLELSLKYADELIALSKLEKNYLYLHRGYYQKGNKNRLAGDLNNALNAFFRSGEAAIKAKFITGEGVAYMAIADVYSTMRNSDNAEIYYAKSINLLRKTNDSISLASALLNAGDEYSKNKKYNLALKYFEESSIIFDKVDYLIGTAYNLGNIGMVYAKQGNNDLAKVYISKAIQILEKLKDYYAISEYLIYMSDIYLTQNDWITSLSYAKRSLDLAQKYGLKEQISNSNLKISQLYQKAGNHRESFTYYKNYITYRDSVTNLKSVQQMADIRTNYEVSQKQVEVDLLEKDSEIQKLKEKKQQNIIYATAISLFLIVIITIGFYRRYKFVKKTNSIIEEEKNRSNNLLLNILPEETALELKKNGKVQAKKFESVTVLFTDFEGFTHYAEKLPPEKLVESIDYYFSKFDTIMEKYNLEKIKTVGDAYMCAGGLPFPTGDHAYKMTLAALEIARFVNISEELITQNQSHFKIRIGINTGPLVAGVVGIKKFSYDIWGDTVNIASRMESNSEPGKINISEYTYQIIKNDFECEYRGEIEVKNKGMMKMYFVNNPIAQ